MGQVVKIGRWGKTGNGITGMRPTHTARSTVNGNMLLLHFGAISTKELHGCKKKPLKLLKESWYNLICEQESIFT